tara:strand:- start:43 stop:501 length:459 start_codon:yes stop_codon:yes gene_type:complete
MNKQNIYDILERQKVILFKKYVKAESKADPRMKAKNDGVSYSGANFIKYVPDETDRTKKAKSYGYYWSDVEILYWDDNEFSYGTEEFVFKREARTPLGQHIRSVFRVLNLVEQDVQAFGTMYDLKRTKVKLPIDKLEECQKENEKNYYGVRS